MVLTFAHSRRTQMADGKSMATPGQLVEAMAAALGIPLPTVTQYDRVLAENGLRTTGGRGLSAARVTAADATNLLLAIMGAPMSGAAIGDAAGTCKLYGTLVHVPTPMPPRIRSYWLRKITSLPAGHSLREAIVALIEGTIREWRERPPVYGSFTLRIRFDSHPPRARIFVASEGREAHRTMTYEMASPRQKGDAVAVGDLRQSREVTAQTIEHIAATLQG
jgi:hypothetical protein